ncbi:hypothetical protein K438DRAFT_1760924 [Mycena galopus ATCC 62051]|nr:hypothetical protein K438DRAFT_1760924 [Mycena galopus ATCC 62051]
MSVHRQSVCFSVGASRIRLINDPREGTRFDSSLRDGEVLIYGVDEAWVGRRDTTRAMSYILAVEEHGCIGWRFLRQSVCRSRSTVSRILLAPARKCSCCQRMATADKHGASLLNLGFWPSRDSLNRFEEHAKADFPGLELNTNERWGMTNA